jgi:hypothetical protein
MKLPNSINFMRWNSILTTLPYHNSIAGYKRHGTGQFLSILPTVRHSFTNPVGVYSLLWHSTSTGGNSGRELLLVEGFSGRGKPVTTSCFARAAGCKIGALISWQNLTGLPFFSSSKFYSKEVTKSISGLERKLLSSIHPTPRAITGQQDRLYRVRWFPDSLRKVYSRKQTRKYRMLIYGED